MTTAPRVTSRAQTMESGRRSRRTTARRSSERPVSYTHLDVYKRQVHGKEITPFLLAKVKDLTGGESLKSNIQLALNNARCAARIAVAYARG